MGNPNNPIFYHNKVKIVHPEMTFENGHIQPNLETCPICGKHIIRADRVSVTRNGQKWHIHKTCRKRQHEIVKVKED